MLSILTVFRDSSTVGHYGLLLSLLSLHPHLVDSMRLKMVIILGSLVAAVDMPVMLHLWLDIRSGNVNYLYFQTLVWGVFLSLLLLEFTGAAVRGQKAEREKEKVKALPTN